MVQNKINKEKIENDLTLSKLHNYRCTEQYYIIGFGTRITDGVKYVCDNGYHWFISDMDIVANFRFRSEPFLVYKLKTDLKNKTAVAYIEDGNDNVLYQQEYDYTSSKVEELKVFKTDNIILLPKEY